jgi:hypothetical protein
VQAKCGGLRSLQATQQCENETAQQNTERLLWHGLLPLLKRDLQFGRAKARTTALKSLYQLCSAEANLYPIVETGFTPVLTEVFSTSQSTDAGLAATILRVLCLITNSSQACRVVVDLLPLFCDEIVQDAHSLRADCVKAVANLSGQHCNCQPMCEADTIPRIQGIVQQLEGETLDHVLQTWSNLASIPGSQTQLLGTLPILKIMAAKYYTDSTDTGMEHCRHLACLFSRLCDSVSNIAELVGQGVVKCLALFIHPAKQARDGQVKGVSLGPDFYAALAAVKLSRNKMAHGSLRASNIHIVLASHVDANPESMLSCACAMALVFLNFHVQRSNLDPSVLSHITELLKLQVNQEPQARQCKIAADLTLPLLLETVQLVVKDDTRTSKFESVEYLRLFIRVISHHAYDNAAAELAIAILLELTIEGTDALKEHLLQGELNLMPLLQGVRGTLDQTAQLHIDLLQWQLCTKASRSAVQQPNQVRCRSRTFANCH